MEIEAPIDGLLQKRNMFYWNELSNLKALSVTLYRYVHSTLFLEVDDDKGGDDKFFTRPSRDVSHTTERNNNNNNNNFFSLSLIDIIHVHSGYFL